MMPPQPPLARLPELWEPWEAILDDAIRRKLKLGDALDEILARPEVARYCPRGTRR